MIINNKFFSTLFGYVEEGEELLTYPLDNSLDDGREIGLAAKLKRRGKEVVVAPIDNGDGSSFTVTDSGNEVGITPSREKKISIRRRDPKKEDSSLIAELNKDRFVAVLPDEKNNPLGLRDEEGDICFDARYKDGSLEISPPNSKRRKVQIGEGMNEVIVGSQSVEVSSEGKRGGIEKVGIRSSRKRLRVRIEDGNGNYRDDEIRDGVHVAKLTGNPEELPLELRDERGRCNLDVKSRDGGLSIHNLKRGLSAFFSRQGRRLKCSSPPEKRLDVSVNAGADGSIGDIEVGVARKNGNFTWNGKVLNPTTLKLRDRWPKRISRVLLSAVFAGALIYGTTEYLDESPERFDSIEELVEANIDSYKSNALSKLSERIRYALTNQGVCDASNYMKGNVTGRHLYVNFNGEPIMRGNEIAFINTDRDYRRERIERNERKYTPASVRFDEIRASLGEDYVIPIEEGELGYPFEIPCNIIDMMKTLTEHHDGRIPPSHWWVWEGGGFRTVEVPYNSAFNVYDDFKDNEGNPALPNELKYLLPAQVLVESMYTLDADSDPVIAGTKRLSEKVFESCTAQDRENYYKLPYGVRCLYTYYDKSINEFKESLKGINANDEEKTKLALYLTMQSFRSDVGTVLQEQESRDFLEELLQDNLSPPEAVHRFVMLNHGEAADYLPYIFAFRGAMNNYVGGPMGN